MGYTTSTVHGIEVPDASEANDVPEDIGKVVTALEGGSIIRRLTGAAIAALTSPQKPAGLVVYNTTTGVLQKSDGTDFHDVIDADGGTMAAALAMGSNKITGMASGTASGDAVNKGQLDAVSTVANAALPKAGGYMTGDVNMQGNGLSAHRKGTEIGRPLVYQQVQHGTTGAISANSSTTITFSPAFASGPEVVAVPMDNLGTTGRWWVDGVSASGATIHQSNIDFTAAAFMWIAVGN